VDTEPRSQTSTQFIQLKNLVVATTIQLRFDYRSTRLQFDFDSARIRRSFNGRSTAYQRLLSSYRRNPLAAVTRT